MPTTTVAVAATAVAVAVAVVLLRHRRRFPRAKKIAYVNTEDASKWEDQLDVFAAALQLPTSAFERFDAFAGELPSAEALQRGDYCGMLLTGSHFSANDPRLPWLQGLFECIRTAAAVPGVRVLGCCFGAQAAAVALGGAVGTNPDGRFCYGVERIALDCPLVASLGPWAHGALRGDSATLPSSLHLLESHGEQVTALPARSELLGWSATAPHEIFLAGEHRNVLCVQAHPEFSAELMQERIAPALRSNGRLTAHEIDERAQTMQRQPLHSARMCDLYRAFLMGGGQTARRRC